MRKLFFLTPLLVLVLHCKEEVAIGRGFVLNSPVQILKKPVKTAAPLKAIQVLSEVEILKMHVPDKNNSKLFWFKVKSGDIKGFISYDEEIIRKNFVSIKPESGNRRALMTANLLIREKPTQKSASVGLLKRGTVASIISEGSLRTTIDGITDTWMGIKTADNKSGYVFGGYIRRGTTTDFDSKEKIEAALAAAEKGWVLITADKPRLETIDENTRSDDDGNNHFPKKGDMVTVTGRKFERGMTFYKIEDMVTAVRQLIWGYTLWIPAVDVEYIPNLYEYTKKLNTSVPAEMFDAINQSLGGDLDARSVKVKTVTLRNEPGVEHFEVAARSGVYSGIYGPPGIIIYLAKQNGQYSLVGKFDNAQLQDIDGDGNMELTTDVSSREVVPLNVYTYKPGKGFKLIFDIVDEYGIETTIDPPYLVTKSFYGLMSSENKLLNPKYKDQRIHVFKLANGVFTEVAQPAKYRKLEAELNASEKAK